MSDSLPHPSSLLLQRLAHGAPPAEGVVSLEQHLAACTRCRDDSAALRASRERFSSHVYARTLPALEERSRRRFGWVSNWKVALLPTFATAVALALVFARPQAHEDPAFTVKGGPIARLVGHRAGSSFPINPGMPLREGDQVRFEVEPAGATYLLIGSVDGAGRASVYVPDPGEESVRIAPDHEFVSPGSVVLDAAAGPERIFVLLSQVPLQAAAVREALTTLGKAGPEGIRQASQLAVPNTRQVTSYWEKEPR